jgi:hypothetical protein
LKILDTASEKIKYELFTNNISFFLNQEYEENFFSKDHNDKFFKDLKAEIYKKKLLIDDKYIRTDIKYLNQIKKIEMTMFMESKRRCRTKRNIEIQYKEEMKSENCSSIGSSIEKEHFVDINTNKDNISLTRLKKKNKIANINNNDKKLKINNEDVSKKKVSLKVKKKKKDGLGNTSSKSSKRSKNKTQTETAASRRKSKPLNNENLNFFEKEVEDTSQPGIWNQPDNYVTISDDEEITFSSKKMMRSLRYNQNKINECYEIYRNSESVNKPLKSLKKRRLVKKNELLKEEENISNECI